MANNPNHLDNLKPFQKGDNRINIKGRPRKFLTALREHGYTNTEITETYLGLLACTINEIRKMQEDPDCTMIIRVCIESIKKSMRQGSLFNIELMLSRALGKPTETVDSTVTQTMPTTTIVQVINTGVPLATSEKDAEKWYK